MAKTVVITGASSGIGLETAKEFARHGYSCAIGARRLEKIKELEKELQDLGAKETYACALDVTDTKSVNQFVSGLFNTFDCIDIVVNNAGGALGFDTIVDGSFSDWETMMDANVMGVLRITKAIVPAMMEQQSGHIINIGSVAGRIAYEKGGVYCASKHALSAITKTLKLELNDYGIRVSTIDPGMVETEFSKVRLRDDQKAKDVYKGMTPLTAKDIAECVYFAASRPAHVNIDEILVMPTDQASVNKCRRR